MDYTKLEKAEIHSREAGTKVPCLFNPKEYTFTKANSWKAQSVSGNVPPSHFDKGQPATLQMELFFDTYADFKSSGKKKDVRKEYTDKLWKLMLVIDKLKDKKTKHGRPPTVSFHWGKSWTFDAVITQLSQKFTMFLPDGTPVRATVNVTFQQIRDHANLAPQNPTSGGVGGETVWTVTEGDTLDRIAYREYGDSSRWRDIAEANHLTSVRRLTPGTVLIIPNG